jgi:hypothetical protein
MDLLSRGCERPVSTAIRRDTGWNGWPRDRSLCLARLLGRENTESDFGFLATGLQRSAQLTSLPRRQHTPSTLAIPRGSERGSVVLAEFTETAAGRKVKHLKSLEYHYTFGIGATK